MSAILNEGPPPISQITPRVPSALERAIHRCLEKNVEQRFQSTSDLAFALEDASDSGSATKHPIDSVMPRTAWKWIKGAGVALAMLLGTLLWHPWTASCIAEVAPITTKSIPPSQCCPHTSILSQEKISRLLNRSQQPRPDAPFDFDSKLFVYACLW
jgi:serine/threonine protein kinase